MSESAAAPRAEGRADRGLRPSLARRLRTLGPLEVVAVVVVVGLVGSVLSGSVLFLLTTSVIYAVFATSVNVLFGWTGMASFGQAAYFGIGAYTIALLRDAPWAPPLELLLGALVATVAATLFSVAAIRTSGVAFAMLTLVFAQVLYLLTFRIDQLGGENGIPGIPRDGLLGVDLGDPHAFLWYALAVAGVFLLGIQRIGQSSLGASLNAVRDDAVRAAALGLPVRQVRIIAFAIAGFGGAIAGGLYAQQQSIVSNQTLFWLLSGDAIIMCLVGGLHRFWGPAIGAVVFTWADWYLRGRFSAPLLYLGVVFLAIVLLLPEGLAGFPVRLSEALRRRRGLAPKEGTAT